MSRPQFFECGCCGHFHNVNLPGNVDCRQDSTRFTEEQLGVTYGAEGWDWVETPGEPWPNEQRIADRIDGYDRDDLGESPDY